MTSFQKLSFLFILGILLSGGSCRWTELKAHEWYAKQKWGAGVNYIPAYADNVIEMWENFDPVAIDRELSWAANFGFSILRVFLHVGPYHAHPEQFLATLEQFVHIAKLHNHRIVFVLFDDCWLPTYHMGKQPEPIPGVHNSQWVQCPGDIPVEDSLLHDYVTKIIGKFSNDTTVVVWDLYNQVGNGGHITHSLPLLKKIYTWARNTAHTQPLTTSIWTTSGDFTQINRYSLSQSDIISFHAYCDVECTKQFITAMKSHRRPVICTEYMARKFQSLFVTHLPIFKEHGVWGINWGFVFGRTQTYMPWDSEEGTPVPEIWFHDVVHPDGSPFNVTETQFIRNITK